MDDPRARRQSDGGADADVIARVLGGDVQAYATLVTRYQRALYRHAVAMVLDHDAASDMVQEAFVRAYTSLRECRDRTRFRAWLFQTLRHRCLDYLKEPRRRHVALDAAENVCDQGDGAGHAGRAAADATTHRERARATAAGAAGGVRDALRGRHAVRRDRRTARRVTECREDAGTARAGRAELGTS
jgi:RNA polymerase sigma-70 factor (ECF subfamily)